MSNLTVANRYADALFQVAKEQKTLEQVNDELQLLKTVIESTPEFIQFLVHPKITLEKKRVFIQESFGGALSEASLHTIYLLIERKRTDILVPLINKFKELSYEAQDKAEAIVYSVKPLEASEQAHIVKLFAKKAGKKHLEVKNVVDPELVGGIKIRIGDRIYDGSVKAQLDRMQRQLIAGTR
ncbi:F0F1 ATP synthase subunit delta [Bacillus suaedae]|uniref:ATP synthase subunit delta n=1 Tax=Halalkalibacter suaedae TaxID=2822140 RepID=A0A940WU47_9BACI|nr:F0F1 ATP synthase subunit delta [Bacillus suaedae]MBP3952789.1 F0F1 ATP synthase subunit delta [Bacillus suaedae]